MVQRYNTEHRHSGIAYLTPEMVHTGRAPLVLAQRAKVLDAAYAMHPERFVRRPPKPPALPEAVWINPPLRNEAARRPRIDDLDPTQGLSTPLDAGSGQFLNPQLGGPSDDMRQ